MFDFSFSEILIILVVAVVVLDPRHLPDVARGAGRWMGRARRFMNKMKEDLDEQVGTEHLAPLRELNQEWQRTRSMLEGSVNPREWQDSIPDESPDRVPPAMPLEDSAAGRAAVSRPAPKKRRRRRASGRRAKAASPEVRKGDGGGEGV